MKAKTRIRGLIGAIVCFLLIGCSYAGPRHSICDDVTDSVICNTFEKAGIGVEDASLFFKIANLEAIKHDVYKKDACLIFLDTADVMLRDPITYASLANYVLGEIASLNSEYGIELILVGEYFGLFQQQLPITDFDRYLISEHIKQQRQLVNIL